MSHLILDYQEVGTEVPATPRPTSLDIFASVQIEAEPCRILYALAMPEYMEAWLHFPDIDRVECHSEQRSFDRFRIDLFCSGTRQHRIFGSCLLSKPNRITYLWERDHAGDQAESTVEMGIWGGPDRCTLRLKHGGICRREEKDWLSRTWSLSLKKLCGLMEGIGTAP